MSGSGRRERYAAWALVLGCLIGALVQTLIIPLQGDLPRLMNASRELTAWVVTATIAGACAVSPLAGRLGDLYGRRSMYLILVGVLVAGSAICAVAPSIGWLIAGRTMQGAAVGLIPLTMSILRDVLPPAELPMALGLASATMGVGAAFGIPLGAAIATALNWRAMFWMVFALGLVTAGLVWRLVPERGVRSSGTFDVIGALGNVAGASMLVIGLSQVVTHGPRSAKAGILILLGGAVMVALVVHLRRAPSPLFDVAVAARPRVLLTSVTSLCLNFATMGLLVVFPQLLTTPAGNGPGLGVEPLIGSGIMMMSGVAQALASPVAGRMMGAVVARMVVCAGVLTVLCSLFLFMVAEVSVWMVLVVNIVAGAGFGLAFAAVPQVIMTSVPISQVASANGLNAQIRMFGTAASAAVVGAILASGAGPDGPTSAAFTAALLTCVVAALLAAVASVRVPPLDRGRPRAS